MKIVSYISRILVGSVFIISGLIKANDTLGFSYKLEEYFENGALAYRIRDWFGWDSFSLEFLVKYALLIAIIMCAAEIILGFALIFAARIKFTLYSLLSLTILFFFLTLHTATCDPFGTYNEDVTLTKNTSQYEVMMANMQKEGAQKIKIINSSDSQVTFQEEMPVQCVKDCGCFGDAMKGSLGRSLSPWESFSKDLILMILLIPIFIYHRKIKLNNKIEDIIILIASIIVLTYLCWVFDWYFPLLFTAIGFGGYVLVKRILQTPKMQWIPIFYIAILSLGFIYYTYSHLPIRDYRPYAVGKSIPDQMILPKNAKPSIYSNIFYYKNKKTGQVEEFTDKNYPWNDDNYEFSDRKTKLIKQGDVAAITDFTITAEDGNDYAQDFFNEEGYVFLFVAYDILKTNELTLKKINTFANLCNNDGNYFIGISASTHNDVENFRHKNQTMFDFYACDAVTLKTIVRANPGIVLMKKGIIIKKWNANNLPDYKVVKLNYLNK